ncbi:MAG: hypothetical protein K8R74_04035 [Bacteroidales bacterium]|nr:hypothetical protein [Bacteroidales bacterium]
MKKITRQEIENTETGIMVDLNCKNNLLVSFGGVKQGIGTPIFEFFNSLSELDCDKIFLRDFKQAWYQKGVDDDIDNIEKVKDFLEKLITEKGYKKICFLGNSMGGYAAILFGSILNVDKVLSFAPQSFIDKRHRLFYRDNRWQNQIANISSSKDEKVQYLDLKLHLNNYKKNKTKIEIYYSHKHRLDTIHAERLKKFMNIELNPIYGDGHEIVKTMRDTGKLINIIKSTFTNDLNQDIIE